MSLRVKPRMNHIQEKLVKRQQLEQKFGASHHPQITTLPFETQISEDFERALADATELLLNSPSFTVGDLEQDRCSLLDIDTDQIIVQDQPLLLEMDARQCKNTVVPEEYVPVPVSRATLSGSKTIKRGPTPPPPPESRQEEEVSSDEEDNIDEVNGAEEEENACETEGRSYGNGTEETGGEELQSPVKIGKDKKIDFIDLRLFLHNYLKNGPVRKDKVINDLESQRSVCSNSKTFGDYELTKSRLKMLVNVGQYLDSVLGKDMIFKTGFINLFNNKKRGVPDMDALFEKVKSSYPFFKIDNLPVNYRSIFVHVFLCFLTYISKVQKRQKDRFVCETAKAMMSLGSIAPTEHEKFLKLLRDLGESIGNKRKYLRRGDILSDSDTESVDLKRRRRADFGHPPLLEKRIPPSVAGSSRIASPRSERLVQPASTSRIDDDAGSIFSTASSVDDFGGRRERIVSFDEAALPDDDGRPNQHYKGRNMSFDEASLPNDYGRPGDHRSSSSGSYTQEARGDDLDPRSIVVDRRVLDVARNGEMVRATRFLSSMAMDRHLAKATYSVVVDIIDVSREKRRGYKLTFRDMISKIVKCLTTDVLGKPCFDYLAILDEAKRTGSMDGEKMEILITSARLLASIVDRENALVKIDWRTVEKWCEELAKVIDQVVFDVNTDRTSHGCTDINTIFEEHRKMVDRMDQIVERRFGHLVSLFRDLASVNEMCLYLIFGLNVTPADEHSQGITSHGITTDVLVKNILLTWRIAERLPMVYGKNVKKTLPVFWSMPFALYMKLHGFGSTRRENVRETVSAEEYYKSAMAIYRNTESDNT